MLYKGIIRSSMQCRGLFKVNNTIETIENALLNKYSVVKNSVSYLTLFSFSTENWKRPRGEIKFLLNLIREYFNKYLDKIIKQGVRIRIVGQINKQMALPASPSPPSLPPSLPSLPSPPPSRYM